MRGLVPGLAAVLLLCLASPSQLPGWVGLLVLPGLAAFYAVVSNVRRPFRWAFAIALCYYLYFSWSLRHVTWAGYVAISLLGPFYELLPVLWLRLKGRSFPGSLAFACGIALGQWGRAHMPEINYPHGQWAHALYHWPHLLGPVAWGGEVLANGLLAWIAAAAVDWYRSWRLASPGWLAARRCLLIPACLWLATCLVDPPRPPAEPRSVHVGVVEPGDREAFRFDFARYRRRFRELLLVPSRELTADAARPVLDLILWPESAVQYMALRGEPIAWEQRSLDLQQLGLAATTRVLLGSSLLEGEDSYYGVSVLLDAEGRLIDWHEKHVPVPAGESMPFLHLLPAGLQAQVRAWAASVVGSLSEMRPGRPRPPLATAGGVPFSALLCYDNAFDQVSRGEVERGARFLVVLSNEAWYLGGAELDQMVAMSVFRALETATPMIRCTVDGASILVDAKGQIVAALPRREAGDDDPRVLRQTIWVGPGGLGSMAWVHPSLPLALLAAAFVLVLTRWRSWARLFRRLAPVPSVERS